MRPEIDLLAASRSRTKGTAVLSCLKRESGQTTSEYAVVLTVIGAGLVGALLLFSGAIEAAYEEVAGLIADFF